VLREVVAQVVAGGNEILGVMLESHLHAGSQRLEGSPAALRYGVSITDACIDWDTTAALLLEADQLLRQAGRTLGDGDRARLRRSGT
jgi:3-deoxy-7-phosphoheptulonate synthase